MLASSVPGLMTLPDDDREKRQDVAHAARSGGMQVLTVGAQALISVTHVLLARLFGRAVFPTEDTIRADTGLPGRPLVVEYSAPQARHLRVLAAQLVAPFRPVRGDSDRPPVRETARPDESAAADDGELSVASW